MSNQQNEEQFEVPPKDDKKGESNEDTKNKIQFLTQQNSSLITILQGVVITLDKISRSQSTNLGTISNQLENVLDALKKSNQPQQQ